MIDILINANEVIVTFPYNEELVEKIRKMMVEDGNGILNLGYFHIIQKYL